MQTDKRREDADGEIAIMGESGDTKHYWNKKNWKEVEAAKATFDSYKAKGFKAYLMNAKGDQGEPLDDFDPSAGKMLFKGAKGEKPFTSVLMVPQMRGG